MNDERMLTLSDGERLTPDLMRELADEGWSIVGVRRSRDYTGGDNGIYIIDLARVES